MYFNIYLLNISINISHLTCNNLHHTIHILHWHQNFLPLEHVKVEVLANLCRLEERQLSFLSLDLWCFVLCPGGLFWCFVWFVFWVLLFSALYQLLSFEGNSITLRYICILYIQNVQVYATVLIRRPRTMSSVNLH